MVSNYRASGKYTLKEIAQKVTDECCMNYFCKDNVTLMLVDLKKHYSEYVRSKKTASQASKRYHSQLRGTTDDIPFGGQFTNAPSSMMLDCHLKQQNWSP